MHPCGCCRCFVGDQPFPQLHGDTDPAGCSEDPLPSEVDVGTVLDVEEFDLHARYRKGSIALEGQVVLIGELSDRSNIPAKTLRFYEDAGVLPKPARTPSGYRDYDDSALDRLRFIASAQAAGLTLAEIRDVIGIRDDGEAPCTHVVELLDVKAAAVARQISELRNLQGELDRLRRRAAEVDPTDCSPNSVCEVLHPRSR